LNERMKRRNNSYSHLLEYHKRKRERVSTKNIKT